MSKPLRLPNASEQAVLEGLNLRLLTEPQEKDRWNQLVSEHHYLKNANLVGEQLRYVVEYKDQWLALLGWSAPALHLKAREQWLGWSPEQLCQRRHFLAQNSRFVLLVDRHQCPNLASRALGLCCQRLSADWLQVHGHPIVAVESFVDSQLMFRGTAYKAAGWTLLGPTAGFGRCAEDFYQRHDRPKQLWIRALDCASTAALKAQHLPPSLAPYEWPAPPRVLSGKPLLNLLDRLPAVPEPRATRGRQHCWPAILGIICLAKLAGVAGGQRDIAEFAKRLNQRQRGQVSCHRNPKTGRREVPSQSTIFRALQKVNYESLESVLLGWQDDILGPADPNELVVLDGKTLHGAQNQVVVNAVAVPSGRVLGVELVRTKEYLQPDDRMSADSAGQSASLPTKPAPTTPTPIDSLPPVPSHPPSVGSNDQKLADSPVQSACPPDVESHPKGANTLGPIAPAPTSEPPLPTPVAEPTPPASKEAQASLTPKKENEIPAARRLLARAQITGRLVSLDAMHTQHQTASQIVIEAGADYLLTLKDNQPTLLKTAQTLLPSAFFPSGPPAKA